MRSSSSRSTRGGGGRFLRRVVEVGNEIDDAGNLVARWARSSRRDAWPGKQPASGSACPGHLTGRFVSGHVLVHVRWRRLHPRSRVDGGDAGGVRGRAQVVGRLRPELDLSRRFVVPITRASVVFLRRHRDARVAEREDPGASHRRPRARNGAPIEPRRVVLLRAAHHQRGSVEAHEGVNVLEILATIDHAAARPMLTVGRGCPRLNTTWRTRAVPRVRSSTNDIRPRRAAASRWLPSSSRADHNLATPSARRKRAGFRSARCG